VCVRERDRERSLNTYYVISAEAQPNTLFLIDKIMLKIQLQMSSVIKDKICHCQIFPDESDDVMQRDLCVCVCVCVYVSVCVCVCELVGQFGVELIFLVQCINLQDRHLKTNSVQSKR